MLYLQQNNRIWLITGYLKTPPPGGGEGVGDSIRRRKQPVSTNVAILGLGTMGSGMAANLLKAGFPLAVYNRTAAKAQPLVDAGARLASTPADAARGASVVISMLADDAASRAVWLGPNGAPRGRGERCHPD